MAISFSDLHTEEGIKSLDGFLAGKTYISGDLFTKGDIKVFGAVLKKPAVGFPNASRWYETVSSHLAARFPGQSVGVRFSGEAAAPVSAPAEEAKKDVEDDDDLDLFGDETEEEKKAAEEREAAVKASSKKKEIAGCSTLIGSEPSFSVSLLYRDVLVPRQVPALSGTIVVSIPAIFAKSGHYPRSTTTVCAQQISRGGKSSVLLDVKPWDDETDMKKLEEIVRSVELPGLLWGASKLVPVGYGIKKLVIMMTIVDDLVSVDNLIEDYLTVEPANEYIQSCDIVAFNKI